MGTNDYVGYELAVKLKAAGFDEPCDHYYARRGIIGDKFRFHGAYSIMKHQNSKYSTASAPTLWQAQKWLREKKGIAINVIAHDGGRYHTERSVLPNCTIPESRDWYVETTTPMVYSYEQALSAGFAAALELIKKGG